MKSSIQKITDGERAAVNLIDEETNRTKDAPEKPSNPPGTRKPKFADAVSKPLTPPVTYEKE
jgi:hypothetical protein